MASRWSAGAAWAVCFLVRIQQRLTFQGSLSITWKILPPKLPVSLTSYLTSIHRLRPAHPIIQWFSALRLLIRITPGVAGKKCVALRHFPSPSKPETRGAGPQLQHFTKTSQLFLMNDEGLRVRLWALCPKEVICPVTESLAGLNEDTVSKPHTVGLLLDPVARSTPAISNFNKSCNFLVNALITLLSNLCMC